MYKFSMGGIRLVEDMDASDFFQELHTEINTHCDYTGGDVEVMFANDVYKLAKGETICYGNEYLMEKVKEREMK